VTKNSVFDSPEANVKASIRSNFMLPALAVVDPLLTLGVPPDVTAATGLDALTQCLEPYVCNACVASAGDQRARS
jgi:alcohol dehydrogenase class IV